MTALPLPSDAHRGSDAIREIALLWPLLGRHIAFHRRLVNITRSVKAAVLLSQIIYWTRHGRDIADTGGWFHKTTTQWQRETGLTAREQAHARDVLIKLGLTDERRRGVPALLHFRLMSTRLTEMVAEYLGRPAGDLDWANGTAVIDLLGPPLAYHRSLAAVSGSVHAGLLLSRSLYLTRYPPRESRDRWIYAPLKFWSGEIGLSRREQETARQALVRLGLWSEDIRGIPPRLFVRLRMAVLLALLRSTQTHPQHRAFYVPASEFTESGILTNRNVGMPPSGGRDFYHPVLTKPPNQYRHKCLNSFNKSAQLNVHSSTGCLVQTPLPPIRDDRNGAATQSGGGDLIFPPTLLAEERKAALTLVSHCPAQAQALLDELAGRLQKNTVHTSPIAYLRGMVQRALAGDFVPELAAGVAAARRRRTDAALARVQRDVDIQRRSDEEATPEFQQKVADRRVRVRQMLDVMRVRNRSRPDS